MKLPDNVITFSDGFGEAFAEDRVTCADASLRGWCAAPLRIVVTWGMAFLGMHFFLKFAFVFVPVNFILCASYGFAFINLLNSDQSNSEHVSFSILA